MKLINSAVFVLLAVVFVAGCTQYGSNYATSGTTGRAVFGITDAATDMGSVTSVKVTIDSVRVQSATEGWITVSSTPKTYDLLKLKAEGTTSLLADAQLKEGSYQQLRLDISKVVVTDDTGDHETKLPSGELKIVGNFVVKSNSTATATFDFVADESLHVTGNGKYILAPVVQMETKEDSDVQVSSEDKIEIRNGRVLTNVKVGMDENGNVGIGLGISKNVNLSVDVNGLLKVEGKSSLGIGLY